MKIKKYKDYINVDFKDNVIMLLGIVFSGFLLCIN
jgi:hypothetical protein